MQLIEAVADILKRESITRLFCYPTSPIIETAVAAGITPIISRQERTGVHIADGYARVTNGRPPAVFAMQYGPGAENAFAGIASAFSDSTPLLLLPMAHPRHVSQQFPMFSSRRAYAPVTKSVEEVVVPEELPNAMRRAFAQLRNGRPGPVMVEMPLDLQNTDVGPYDYVPVPTVRSMPDPLAIDKAAGLLLGASRPMILAGQGVLYARVAGKLQRLADMIQAPVMTTVDAKSAFPEDHPLSLGVGGIVFTGHGLDYLNTKADLILAVGAGLTRHQLSTPGLPKGVKLIHATNDTRDIGKTYDTEVGLLGDAALTLSALIDAVQDRVPKSVIEGSVADVLAPLREAWIAKWYAKLTSNEKPITPYRVIHEFSKLVDPAQTIVTHDSGSPRDQIMPFYQSTTPRGYIGWGKSHQLGSGLGLIIGAKIAAPEKFCVNFMGDAAFGMTGLDFETAIRVDAPILTVVFNNSSMAIEHQHMKYSHEKLRTRDIGGDYAGIARDLGGWSERVEEPGQIADALKRAKQKTEEGKAALLEFITSEEVTFSHRNGAPD